MKKLKIYVCIAFWVMTGAFVQMVQAQAKRASTTPARPATTTPARPATQPARPATSNTRPATSNTRPAAQPTRATSVPRVSSNTRPTAQPTRPNNNSSTNNRSRTASASPSRSGNNATTRTASTATTSTTPAPTTTAPTTTPSATRSAPVNNRKLVLTAKENCFVTVNDGTEIEVLKDTPVTIPVGQSVNKIIIRTTIPAMSWTQEVANVTRGAKKQVELNFVPWYQARLNQMEQERNAAQQLAVSAQLQARPAPPTLVPNTTLPTTNGTTNAAPTTILPPTPQRGQLWTNSINMAFIWISEGNFQMGKQGNIEDSFAHEVILTKGFWMSRHEVTQAQWTAVMGSNPSEFKGDNRPVENVTYTEVQEYIRRLNEKEGWNKYMLPSEAQWEYAARSGTDTRYVWGNRIDKNRANCLNCGSTWDGKETAPVGSFSASPWGLHDMYGNVMEWVSDFYGEKYYTTPEARQDPKGPSTGDSRIVRGGAFDINGEELQSHIRGFVPETFKRNDLGFRLVVKAD